MPTVFVSEGIKVVVYFNDHEPPHVHAEYSGHKAVYSLDPFIECILGYLPPNKDLHAREKIEEHYDEIMQLWNWE